ncbi:Piwi domain-containing protein [Hyaloraphidium curvatum]|nr:Piwi domain-containing protein [Hyaloraphidium curvatum]
MTLQNVSDFHQYDVVIKSAPVLAGKPAGKPSANRNLNRAVFAAWQVAEQNAKGVLVGNKGVKLWCTYDGMRIMFASADIGPGQEYRVVGVKEPDSEERRDFFFTIQKTGVVPVAPLLSYHANPKNVLPPSQDLLTALDHLLRQHASMSDLASVGRSFFDPRTRQNVERSAMLMLKGVYTSARWTQNGAAVNVDVANGVFYPDGPMLDAIVNHLQLRSMPQVLADYQRNGFLLKFRNVLFKVTHRGQKGGRYRLRTLSKGDSDTTTFEGPDGKKVSIRKYFEANYNYTIKFPKLPLAEVHTAGPSGSRVTYFHLECCVISPNQRFLGRLSEDDTSSLVKFATSPPSVRERDVNGIRATMGLDERNQYLKAYGVGVQPKLVEIEARRIPGPKLKYADLQNPQKQVLVDPGTQGFWPIPRGGGFIGPGEIRSFAIMCFADPRATSLSGSPKDRDTNVRAFARMFVKVCRESGMRVAPAVLNGDPQIVYMNRGDNIATTLTNIKSRMPPGAVGNLILVVMPADAGNVPEYQEVKRVSETVLGVTTQCMKPKWVRNMDQRSPKPTGRALYSNLVLKVNVKLGGLNTHTATGLPIVDEQPTMLVGIDVTHPPPGSNAVSIAAVVASMNRECSLYRSSIVLQEARQEVLGALDEVMIDQLRLFALRNGRLPTRIIVYRDGVSEGQFQTVLDEEAARIKSAVAQLNERRKREGQAEYAPKLTFIVVQKRHHTRFFFERDNTDNKGNALPGTVVDTGIVSPESFEFYIVSHPGLQGTSRPTKYQVLYDESNLGSDALQTLTHHLCFLFARSQRAVSIPPPAYYAHLVADRARCHVRGEGLSDTLSAASGQTGRSDVSLDVVKEELRTAGMWFV